jgi:hypothetical protein
MAIPPPPSRRSNYQRLIQDSDGQLETWLREFDRSGALPQARAAMDNAYAQGHASGLEEAREEHLDATRTLLLNLLESKFGEVDYRELDRIEEAGLPRLQRWILALLTANSVAEVLEN